MIALLELNLPLSACSEDAIKEALGDDKIQLTKL